MKRREFIALVGGAAAWPFVARAQQAAKVQRVGFLSGGAAPTPATPNGALEALRKALTELGHVEGQNITIEGRWSEGGRPDRLPEAAAALVGLKVDVITVVGALAARAVKRTTSDIPIVFGVVADPIAVQLVANLERPDENVTGFTTFDPLQAKKQLEILKEAIPGLARVALLGDAAVLPALFQANEDAARAQGLQTQALKVRAPDPDLEGALVAAKNEGAGAVVILEHPVTGTHRRRIAELAVKHRLPTLVPRDFADAGGMISCGTAVSEASRRAATYVDKILKGARPGDLPVIHVSKFELVINLKTAKALGLTVPPALLARADEVIK